MAIPFFSIDLSNKEFFKIIKDFFLPINLDKSQNKINLLLNERFKNKYINILPSARLGFYLTLKKNLKEGDEIIFSSMSFPLYLKIASELKLKIKLVDVDSDTMNINHKLLEEKISQNTKCIVVTHLFGYPCKIDEIKKITKKNNILLVEDCAQSFDTFYKNTETGMFGDVGIFSCSLIKIPTTLSGGILISSNKELNEYINNWTEKNIKFSFKKKILLFVKNIVSVINSYPLLYSILTSKIFFFLDKLNPRIYRKIIYSGMGISKKKFDAMERSTLSKYQIEFGLGQLKKLSQMKIKRKANIEYLIANIKSLENIELLNYENDIDWNYQYFVIKIKKNFEKFNKILFKQGIHAMEENVWNCLDYDYEIQNYNDNFEITSKNNPKLLRIQNSSYLNKNHLDKIIMGIKKAHEQSK